MKKYDKALEIISQMTDAERMSLTLIVAAKMTKWLSVEISNVRFDQSRHEVQNLASPSE
ncbi:hypothetical protein [Glaciimonas immobilis]|nr:hypothetical protein [Glaciimonas immobilis]